MVGNISQDGQADRVRSSGQVLSADAGVYRCRKNIGTDLPATLINSVDQLAALQGTDILSKQLVESFLIEPVCDRLLCDYAKPPVEAFAQHFVDSTVDIPWRFLRVSFTGWLIHWISSETW